MPAQPDAYEFSIKTPVTPVRWADYDAVRACCKPFWAPPCLCYPTLPGSSAMVCMLDILLRDWMLVSSRECSCCAQELSMLWEALLGAMESGDMPELARCILTFAYTWYNFMPLARGTAAAGYVAILALFAAAGMPVSTPCPKVIFKQTVPAEQPEQRCSSSRRMQSH